MTLYSHSRISCFEQCPFRFKLKYIDKVRPPIEQTIETFMGSMVHKALEKLYSDRRFNKLATLEDILRFYNAQWEANWNPGILVVKKGYTPENYRQTGEVCIRNYYKTHHPFDQTKTVGLEHRVSLDLNGDGRYMMQGFIDRLSYAGNGVYEIHDYKTGSSLPQRQQLERDRQLALYALAVKGQYHNVSDIRLVWHYLSFGQEIVLKKTEEELEEIRKKTIEAINEIESAREFPLKTSALCGWCEFRSMCPEFAHLVKTESMNLNRFLEEPGVVLVDRYAKLSEKRKEIDDEMGEVKEALFEFSKKSNVNVVSGSGYDAKIWRAEKITFPGRDDGKRRELEELILKMGIWNDVSSLDTFLLSKKMEKPPWPDELAKAIERFGKRELLERVYLRKKNQIER